MTVKLLQYFFMHAYILFSDVFFLPLSSQSCDQRIDVSTYTVTGSQIKQIHN